MKSDVRMLKYYDGEKLCRADTFVYFFNIKSQNMANNFTDKNYYVSLFDNDMIKKAFVRSAVNKFFQSRSTWSA